MLISTMTTKSSQIFLKSNSEIIFLFGSILTSLGILLVTVGGSWDITNHLLSKPETFFSPPHALMYSGVAISLVGVVLTFVGWKNLQKFKHNYFLPLKIKLIGIGLLTGAGPLDFIWHSYFGLDGLLSPPHFTLIIGMFLCSVGGMIGISRYLKFNEFHFYCKIFVDFGCDSCLAICIWNNFFPVLCLSLVRIFLNLILNLLLLSLSHLWHILF